MYGAAISRSPDEAKASLVFIFNFSQTVRDYVASGDLEIAAPFCMNYQFAYRRYSLPFRTPVRTAHGVWVQREGIIVRLEREDGCVGFGECAPIPWFGTETVDEAAEVFASFGSRVSDEQIASSVEAKLGCVRFAFQSATQGRAKPSTEPDKARNGTTAQPEASPYLPVAALLPAGRAILEKIPALVEAGFRTFKWKVGAGDAADEMALLNDVFAALPDGSRLRLDANGAWDRRLAERWLSRCVDYPVDFIEQPVSSDAKGSEDLLLGLAGDYPTPLALDESVTGAKDIEKWLGLGWPGVFVIKPSLCGDFENVSGHLPKDRVVFSSALETAVGATAALRMAFEFFSNVQKPRALGFGVWPLFADSRFDGPRAAPFVRRDDLENLSSEILWNTLN